MPSHFPLIVNKHGHLAHITELYYYSSITSKEHPTLTPKIVRIGEIGEEQHYS
jgi:hypothetical protein